MPNLCLTASSLCIWYATQFYLLDIFMAKKNILLIKLVSSADTGFYYVTKKNPKTKTEKLSFRKYDPVARKHVVFNEAKIK